MAKIDEFPKGQISNIILMCLKEKDKYGYEIIEEVLSKTNGKISIKQPSLYSNLKRMEEQSLISSYWRDSEIGGRRHYYHLTDLGKKHLEKWQNNFSFSDFTSNNENQTKVIHQESLFTLEENKKEAEPQYSNEQEKQSDTFIQFDLFSKQTTISMPSKNEKTAEQNYALPSSVNAPQNPIVTEYEKPQEMQIRKFDYVKKSNKSFADKIKDINRLEERKFIEKDNNNAINSQIDTISNNNIVAATGKENDLQTTSLHPNILINEREIESTLNSNISFNDNALENIDNETTQQTSVEVDVESTSKPIVDLSSLHGYIPRTTPVEPTSTQTNPNSIENLQENKADDGVFITERLDIKDIPKQPKFEARNFEVYIADNSLSLKLQPKQKSNYEDRIKDLYEKSKSNAENQELEVIDSKIKFSSYKELQEFYNEQNIKFKPYQKTLYRSEKNFDMIRISKLNMLTTLLLFACFCFFSIVVGSILLSTCPKAKFNSPLTYTILPLILFIAFAVCLFDYNRSPQKRIAYDINKFKFNYRYFILSLLTIPLIFAGNLLVGFNFANFYRYAVVLIYPCIMSLTYISYYIIQKILIKWKALY